MHSTNTNRKDWLNKLYIEIDGFLELLVQTENLNNQYRNSQLKYLSLSNKHTKLVNKYSNKKTFLRITLEIFRLFHAIGVVLTINYLRINGWDFNALCILISSLSFTALNSKFISMYIEYRKQNKTNLIIHNYSLV